jgi:hypothetical protein
MNNPLRTGFVTLPAAPEAGTLAVIRNGMVTIANAIFQKWPLYLLCLAKAVERRKR